jgi:hypothetical protein
MLSSRRAGFVNFTRHARSRQKNLAVRTTAIHNLANHIKRLFIGDPCDQFAIVKEWD